MKILKFGGSSLASGDLFDHVSQLVIQSSKKEQTGVVLSAPAKTTNLLVKIISESINHKNIDHLVDEGKKLFYTIIDSLANKYSNYDLDKVKCEVDKEFSAIITKLKPLTTLSICPDNINASIICMGEKLSILMMQQLLSSQGLPSTIIDPVENLVATNDDYLEAYVDIAASKENIQGLNIPNDHVILMPGFTAGNQLKEIVALGRNGSDYSATILATCLQADSCEIWTDVDGIYTCDPRLVPTAKFLKAVSYEEAMELAFFGASVLHPKTILPIVQYKIPCYIKNTNNPEHIGTLIKEKGDDTKGQNIKGITNLDNIVMFNISGPGLKGKVGMSARIFSAIANANVSLILITQSSSEYSISFCIDNKSKDKALKALESEFKEELAAQELEPISIIDNLSIVTVVGDGMKSVRGVAAKIFTAVAKANINVVAIAQGSSESSISIVVKKADTIMGLRAIHQLIFDTEQTINLFIVGVGGIGKALISQIHKQQAFLNNKQINLKVCGILNSKTALVDLNGINLSNWEENLANSTENFTLDNIISTVAEYKLLNPMVVDCTSSDHVVDKYIDFIINGLHIVTPNKKANTREYEFYKVLRELANKHQRQFRYETNVGAGLPVIENLQNLLNAGDELQSFVGILSGSISYIFGKLEEGMSFSEAILSAKELGYTEPDPRDDLSGMDVARKLLIIARETNAQIELTDIDVEALIPEKYFKYSLEEFMQRLPELDQEFETSIKDIKKENEVLRYVGMIDENKKCSVKIISTPLDNPFARIKNGENALSFLTNYYQPCPLILRGYGAGENVTAAGIFADILRVSSTNQLGIFIE